MIRAGETPFDFDRWPEFKVHVFMPLVGIYLGRGRISPWVSPVVFPHPVVQIDLLQEVRS